MKKTHGFFVVVLIITPLILDTIAGESLFNPACDESYNNYEWELACLPKVHMAACNRGIEETAFQISAHGTDFYDSPVNKNTRIRGGHLVSDPIKILFIGSSYFNYHNLPQLFENLALSAGKEVYIDHRIISGWYLDQHASSNATESKIYELEWDYVVLQGVGTNTAYPDYFTNHPVYPALVALRDKIHENCESTKMVFCMPWAFEDGMTWYQDWTDTFEDMQIKIYENTLQYAADIDFMISPVGWAWYGVLKNLDYPLHYLHMNDWNHPSLRGSYLMACVIFSTLFQQSSVGVAYHAGLPREEVDNFQTIASETVLDHLDLWNIVENYIIFVDDDNTEGPWDGTQDNPYRTIQDGIEAVSETGTVHVCNGTYQERLAVDKMIILMGENKYATIIEGNGTGPTVEILGDGVTIQNFSVKGGGSDEWNGAGICVTADHVVLKHNIIRDNSNNGISFLSASHCTISNNIFINNSYGGLIFTEESHSNFISQNTITSGISGIYVSSSNQLIISNNTVTNCSKGIYLTECSGNTVVNNHLMDNTEGLFSYYAVDTAIRRNNFISNERHARFAKFFHIGFLAPNTWGENYWDDWIRVGVKCIFGAIYIRTFTLIGIFVPWIEIDWQPAHAPYG